MSTGMGWDCDCDSVSRVFAFNMAVSEWVTGDALDMNSYGYTVEYGQARK